MHSMLLYFYQGLHTIRILTAQLPYVFESRFGTNVPLYALGVHLVIRTENPLKEGEQFLLTL